MKTAGWAIVFTSHMPPFEGRQQYRLKGNEFRPMDYEFSKCELYATKKIANRMVAKYMKNSAFGTETYEVVKITEEQMKK